MYFPLFIFVLHLTAVYCVGEEELVTVVAVYRHGDRTPIKSYPNDPYGNASYWPTGFGQLTNIGKMEHFLLGQWLRNHYRFFLPKQYSENDVFVRSTNVDRTLMSAEANLAGLFPPRNNQIWNSNLKWQPIPIHTTPETLDNILAMKYPCDKYSYLLKQLETLPEFKKLNAESKELYDYLTKYTGEDIHSLTNLLYLYDTLMIEQLYNFTLPNWTKTVFPHKMAPLANIEFAVECYTPELRRLKIGPLFNDILTHFFNSINNKGYKFITYSAHDTTIANILNGLQLFDYHCPPYTATILFELRHLNGSYFVTMLYKNSSEPQNLILKNCSLYCPLDKFIEILHPMLITPSQWKEECQLSFTEYSLYPIIQDAVYVSALVFLVLACIIAAIHIVSKMTKTREHNYVRLPDQENMDNS